MKRDESMIDLQSIGTEARNLNTMNIDALPTAEILAAINREDQQVANAVKEQLPYIEKAADAIYERLRTGGRLIYCGCGTSGRIGVLDAVECPPTYNTNPEMVQALMAGGPSAFLKAVEGAEDDEEMGAKDLARIHLCEKDVLMGIAASGRTPYVIGAMTYAHSVGAMVLALTGCPDSEVASMADISIAPLTGPEVVTGSTRMKCGTAQKMVLNMLSTTVMIRLGKVYSNLMVDVKATNQKLVERSIQIVQCATGVARERAIAALESCNQSAKVAIVMLLRNTDALDAETLLKRADGHTDRAIKSEAQ